MKRSIRFCTTFLLLLSLSWGVNAQQKEEKQEDSKFDKSEAFSPLFLNELSDSFHSATGKPGPNYWQNQSDYEIQATIDTVNHRIKGTVHISYTNNSPYELNFLWLQLDQNAFREDSRSKALYPAGDRNGVRTPTKGYELKQVSVNKNEADYVVNDTRMQIRLSKPVKAEGGKAEVSIQYEFKIPTHGKDRMGRVETENGWIYTIAQWYPRMAVYDEVEGWNNIPYLGTGEFYLEFGKFDYTITAPANMVVVGSGMLQNPRKVLAKEQRKRLKKARKSDTTVTILSKQEMLEGTHHKEGKDGMLSWHFKMDNSHDIAWAASKAFIWDAARMNLPDDKKGLAQSVYPAENSGNDGYGRSTEYTKNAIEIYSKDWYPYPYHVATNVGGHEGGMEYPGLVFCSYKSKDKSLWGVINHEFGHTWFPMIVGSNERVYAWLDEGLNTFINDITTEQFNDGEYAENKDFQDMGKFLFNDRFDPLFTRADVIHDQQNLGIEAYYKPGTALHVLRNVVLGKDRFDYAFRTYIKEWAYKHPQPWDFFNAMSNASGEDLGWFFRGWFMKNWAIDQAVESIDYIDDNYKNGATITLLNKAKMPMPVTLKIDFKNGHSKTVKLPVEIWMTGAKYVYHLDSDTEISAVEIDPEHLTPDEKPGNNKMEKLGSAPKDLSAKKVIDDYLEAIGGREKMENIKDYSTEMKASVQGRTLTFKEKRKQPDKYLRKTETMGQTVQKILVNGDEFTFFQQGKEQDLSETDKKYLKTIFIDEKHIELKAEKSNYDTKLLGVDSLNGKNTYVIKITTPKGNSFKNYYDTESGLKIKEVNAEGSESYFSNYQKVNDIKIPFTITEQMMGQKIEMNVEKAEINSGIEDAVFEKDDN